MNTQTITVTNPTRTRKWGWGWTNTPTGRDAYSIAIPSGPDFTGTLNQVLNAISGDRTFASMKSGGTFTNTAWFYDGKRITNRDEFTDWLNSFDSNSDATPVAIVVEVRETIDTSAAAAALGSMTSDAKAAAARENGKRGGRPTAEQQIRRMLKEVYEEGDVNAAQIFKGYAHDTFQSGWHLRFFNRSDHIFMGTSVAEVSAYCDDVRSNREQDIQHYASV